MFNLFGYNEKPFKETAILFSNHITQIMDNLSIALGQDERKDVKRDDIIKILDGVDEVMKVIFFIETLQDVKIDLVEAALLSLTKVNLFADSLQNTNLNEINNRVKEIRSNLLEVKI